MSVHESTNGSGHIGVHGWGPTSRLAFTSEQKEKLKKWQVLFKMFNLLCYLPVIPNMALSMLLLRNCE